MSPADFEADTDRLWAEVKPLYDKLHCYVRGELRKVYGPDKIGPKAPIPAHLLGNMWAQEWHNIYDLVEPYKGEAPLDVTRKIKARKRDEKKMVKQGERFFISLGFDPLPETFWERSLFKKPADHEVVCHASAWDVTCTDDLRIKMCIEPTEDDLTTIHHELGHDYYFHRYYKLPILFQQGANDGFHEGIGDTIALSVTPAYLKEHRPPRQAPAGEKGEINELMKMALDKVAFLPFGLLIDKWRWDVFAGKTPPPTTRARGGSCARSTRACAAGRPHADDFDPGAKYHVASNAQYVLYFLARIYQFQFHAALCKAAGYVGPLDQCSIAGEGARARSCAPCSPSAAASRGPTPWRRYGARQGGRGADARVLRAAVGVAEGPEQGQAVRVVRGGADRRSRAPAACSAGRLRRVARSAPR